MSEAAGNPLFSQGRTCASCQVPVNNRCKTGMCRSCAGKERHSNPEWKARQHAALKAACSSPENRAKISEVGKKLWSDPNRRAAMSARKKQELQDPARRAKLMAAAATALRNWHATTDRDWSAYHKARAAKQMAWCPEDRREEYRRLRQQFGAAEARRMIKADLAAAERRRLAAMDPLERQMERLTKGAQLVPAFNPKRVDHDFTLGGIAPEAM